MTIKNISIALLVLIISSTVQAITSGLQPMFCQKNAEVIFNLTQAPKKDLTILINRGNTPHNALFFTPSKLPKIAIKKKGFISPCISINLTIAQPDDIDTFRIVAPEGIKVVVHYNHKKIGIFERNGEQETFTIPRISSKATAIAAILYTPLERFRTVPSANFAALTGTHHDDEEIHLARSALYEPLPASQDIPNTTLDALTRAYAGEWSSAEEIEEVTASARASEDFSI